MIDLSTDAVAATIDMGPDVRNVAVNASGELLVTAWRGSSEGAAVHLVDVGEPPRARLVGTTMLEAQRGLDSDTDNHGVPSFFSQVVFSPDGAHALIAALKANVVAGLSRTGAPLTSQTSARGILVEIALGGVGEPPFEVALSLRRPRCGERGRVFSRRIAHVHGLRGSESIVAVDPFSYDMVGSIGEAGTTPEGLAISPDGRFLFVQALLSRSVRMYDVTAMPAPALLVDVRTAASEPLSPEVLAGRIVFNRARSKPISSRSTISSRERRRSGLRAPVRSATSRRAERPVHRPPARKETRSAPR